VTGVLEIERIIPHRPPFRLVDEIVEVRPGEGLTAVKRVGEAEAAHRWLVETAEAPEDVYPIGLVMESWAQSAVVLCCWDQPNPDVLTGMVELAVGFADVELLEPVRPGDRLEHRVRLVKMIDDVATLAGTSHVGDRTVARIGEFIVAMRPVEVLRAARGAA
jgi:3-hydroxyacyl-[acyl-carrier-protein] dehydratase